MDFHLVSVVIPAYNRAHSIGKSVESVLQQTYRPLELIVVDDGSTDGTVAALSEFGDRIVVIRQPNGGPSSARNTGVANAKGGIISFLDSDDTWEPAKLERQVSLMNRGGEEVICCVCNSRNFVNNTELENSFEIAGVDGEITEGFWLNPAELIATRFILFNQVVAIRRSAFEKVGGFKEHMRLLEDHDLAFRLSLLGPWAFISEPLVNKFDQADGIGVTARLDPMTHARAWADALRGFLEEPLAGISVRRWILEALKDVELEIAAARISRAGGPASKAIPMLMKSYLRLKGAIRRRLPSWPKTLIVSKLPS